MSQPQLSSLDFTHVLYDDSSLFSLALALITLSPILLMASYAALTVQTREYIIIVMWAGQLFGEALNWVLKHTIKQDRPSELAGNGYGFPSSHSQYMGYFSAFLVCHLYFRHRFSTTGYPVVDAAWRLIVYLGLMTWAVTVAYSRYHLEYHTPHQILWGFGIGAVLGIALYTLAELIPQRRPNSILGQVKAFLLANPLSTWLQIRDGWAIWADGGRETEWQRWRAEWNKSRSVARTKRSQ
ncbi:hypothetical protein C8J56DRAFT_972062 [Mycena floridula]|nr:hypothetical protein C8J56DRAFT_972062 [Mycena floridula]